MKKKAKRKPTTKALRAKAWSLVSKYVRLRDANKHGFAQCVTCGVRKPWKELQAGHFIPQARGNAIRWDLRGIHPQCYRCNINLGGNGVEYTLWMLGQYGIGIVDDLRQVAATTKIMRATDYEAIIEDMSARLAWLVTHPGQREDERWALDNIS